MVERISLAELRERIQDPSVDEASLRPYLIVDHEQSRPFNPVLRPNPETVEIHADEQGQLEGAAALTFSNGMAHWRRRLHFWRSPADAGPVLVEEGDSWHQFPIFLDDVVDNLNRDFRVWSVGAAGDTLQNMVHASPEYLHALEMHRDSFKAFLFSGAGNDIVGEEPDGSSVLEKIVSPFEVGQPIDWYIANDAFNEKLAFIEKCYRIVFEDVGRHFPGRPVLLHGYDYSIPGGVENETRKPRWAAVDEWIGRFMKGDVLKFQDHAQQAKIIRLLVDRLNEMQKRLCGGNNPGGVYPHAYHVDVRGTLTSISDWADELHPTDAGFQRVSEKIVRVLRRAGVN